ncbi:uncharacterized protein LOC120355036 [Nilaparvata lugens]|uniref:uncharacterized protein LOC120355036 n=1 Tax=Nilaparvata lugens TaxID=108931 RepID=UPI00193D9FD5|nr:uncharacterized protein LOC120355036 [Nilaparvata lugens]XP_039299226.1 uncharacterized protein LOC120355036 [Nilaparvata lugens]
MTGDYWRILVVINITEISHELSQLHNQTQEMQNAITTALEKMPALHIQKQAFTSISDMQDDISDSVRTLMDLLYQGRGRRGLINAGGKLLCVIFGVAEDEDHSEGALQAQTAGLIHVEKEHLTLTQHLSRRVAENSRELVEIARECSKNTNEIVSAIKKLNQKVVKIEELLDVYINTSSALQNLRLASSNALLDLRKLITIINEVSYCRLSINLLSPVELSNILEKVRSSLSDGLELPFVTNPTSAYLYYNIMRVHAVSVGGLIKLIVMVPLMSPGQRFELFQAFALPVLDNQTQLMIQYQLKPAHRMLMTPYWARLAVIHQQQLEQCEAGPLTVCLVMTPVYSRHHPSCLSALFLNDLAAAQQQCQLTVLAANPADTWVWNDQDDTWIYSVASKRQVVSQCQQGNQIIVHELTLHGTGHLAAP